MILAGKTAVQARVDITKLVPDSVGIDQVPEVPGHQRVDQGRGNVPAGQCHEPVAEGQLPEKHLVVIAEVSNDNMKLMVDNF